MPNEIPGESSHAKNRLPAGPKGWQLLSHCQIKRKCLPRIFQVRSSFANFFKSTFSSRSFLNFSPGVVLAGSVLAAGSFLVFTAFSFGSGFSVATLGVVDFFSLLAMNQR